MFLISCVKTIRNWVIHDLLFTKRTCGLFQDSIASKCVCITVIIIRSNLGLGYQK